MLQLKLIILHYVSTMPDLFVRQHKCIFYTERGAGAENVYYKKALVVPPVSLHCDRFSAGEEAEVAPHPLTQTKSHDVMLSPFMQGIRGAARSKPSPAPPDFLFEILSLECVFPML